MSLQTNSQRRLQSSTRINLARDLHNSLAQDLVAIAYKLDLLLFELPARHRGKLREVRADVTSATSKVRQTLFDLRRIESDYKSEIEELAAPMKLTLLGESDQLDGAQREILNELIRNAAQHSKGHNLEVSISKSRIVVQDDGQGLHGVSEQVAEIGGQINISCNEKGTRVEICFP